MCGAFIMADVIATSGSNDSLYVSLIGLAGAVLGAIALVYTSRYKTNHEDRQAFRTGLTSSGLQAFEENSHRLDRIDERINRLERQIDVNTGRIDRLIDRETGRGETSE